MLEALRISADIPPQLPESDRDQVEDREKAADEPKLIELMQVSFAKAYAAHFTVFGGHFISIHTKRLFRRPVNYWIDLRYVEPMPMRSFVIDRPALWVTAALALLSAIFFLVAWLSDKPLFWLAVAVPLVCAAVIAALILAQRSKHRIVFCSRYGRIPWFELLVAKPGRRAVDDFIETLTGAIHKASNDRDHGEGGRLGAELREQRRLRDGGILSEQDYKTVMARLLKQHG
jgi:hypothetical protein